MSNYPKPLIDVWFHKGVRAAMRYDNLETAIRAMGQMPVTEEPAFTRGYHIGRVKWLLEAVTSRVKHLPNYRLIALEEALQPIAKSVEESIE